MAEFGGPKTIDTGKGHGIAQFGGPETYDTEDNLAEFIRNVSEAAEVFGRRRGAPLPCGPVAALRSMEASRRAAADPTLRAELSKCIFKWRKEAAAPSPGRGGSPGAGAGRRGAVGEGRSVVSPAGLVHQGLAGRPAAAGGVARDIRKVLVGRLRLEGGAGGGPGDLGRARRGALHIGRGQIDLGQGGEEHRQGGGGTTGSPTRCSRGCRTRSPRGWASCCPSGRGTRGRAVGGHLRGVAYQEASAGSANTVQTSRAFTCNSESSGQIVIESNERSGPKQLESIHLWLSGGPPVPGHVAGCRCCF